MSLPGYFTATRAPRYSLVFALPLLVLYEALATLLPGAAMAGVRNGADVLLKTVFVAFGGRTGLTVFGVGLLGLGAWFAWRDWRRHQGPLRSGVFAAMFVESMVYAAVLGTVTAQLTAILLAGVPLSVPAFQGSATAGPLPLGTQLVISLGAGIYEELVFRVLLVSGLTTAAVALGARRSVAIALAIVLSALIFSGFHYVGPLGDTFAVPSFTFRAIAGLLLSALYAARGFGIAAWTHALYDVGLSLLGRG
ncbi:MAG TPA: CPBP family glutamic-type intramembrane protease [Gemmatimonadales bacterium]|nr:CPBP family glutamic-type intramembrane protease [Gemmatimonadales bacterium]